MATARQWVDAALAQVVTLSVDEATARLAHGCLVVDLREASECQAHGVIEGAVHVPRGVLEFRADPQSPWHAPAFESPDQPLLLVCAIGWRSALAAQTLQQLGYRNVAHLGGGMEAWREAGRPMTAFDPD
jgi:rhodanese-related sulfurtransferase